MLIPMVSLQTLTAVLDVNSHGFPADTHWVTVDKFRIWMALIAVVIFNLFLVKAWGFSLDLLKKRERVSTNEEYISIYIRYNNTYRFPIDPATYTDASRSAVWKAVQYVRACYTFSQGYFTRFGCTFILQLIFNSLYLVLTNSARLNLKNIKSLKSCWKTLLKNHKC